MATDGAADGWSRAQRRLHWVTAGLVAAGFALGWIMVAVPLRDLLTKFLLFQAHKTIGLTVAALLIWRLALRARRPRPAPEAALTAAERRAAAAGQAVLYALLAAVPVLGYLTACTAPSGIPTLFLLVLPVPAVIGPDPSWYAVLRVVHRWAAVTLIVLAAGHGLAALRHHRRGRAVLRRMWGGGGQHAAQFWAAPVPLPPVLVMVPPPLLYLAVFAAGLGLDALLPWHPAWLRSPVLHAIGWLALGLGAALAAGGIGVLHRRHTTVIPFGQPARLVASGPFRFSRNPIYLALTVGSAGAALLAGRAWLLVLVAVPLAVMHRIVIPFEERRLRATFGAAYDAYCGRVGRWIGWTGGMPRRSLRGRRRP